MQVNSLRNHNPNGGITIRERCPPAAEGSAPAPANEEDRQQQADADYARQLQAKLDAQEARGGPRSASLPCTVLPLPWGHICRRSLCVDAGGCNMPAADTICT